MNDSYQAFQEAGGIEILSLNEITGSLGNSVATNLLSKSVPTMDINVQSGSDHNVSLESFSSTNLQSVSSLSSVNNTSVWSRESDRNDIDEFFSLRAECAGNLLIGFLNINSLRNKITDLRMIAERCLPDVLLIEETKLNSDFKTKSFLINNYKSPIVWIGLNLEEVSCNTRGVALFAIGCPILKSRLLSYCVLNS